MGRSLCPSNAGLTASALFSDFVPVLFARPPSASQEGRTCRKEERKSSRCEQVHFWSFSFSCWDEPPALLGTKDTESRASLKGSAGHGGAQQRCPPGQGRSVVASSPRWALIPGDPQHVMQRSPDGAPHAQHMTATLPQLSRFVLCYFNTVFCFILLSCIILFYFFLIIILLFCCIIL